MDGHMRGERIERESEGGMEEEDRRGAFAIMARSNHGQKYDNVNWRKERHSSRRKKEVSYRKEKLVLSEITG